MLLFIAGELMWVDQTPVQYQNWVPGFPGDADDNKDCAVMNYNDYHGQWMLVACNRKEYVICKMPKSMLIHYSFSSIVDLLF